MADTSKRSELSVWEQARRDSDLTLELPGGVLMFFRKIPAGRFRLGSRGYDPTEEPVHEVVITQDFYLGTFVVTQEQWRAVAKKCPALKKQTDPSDFKGDRRPVEQVSWLDADAFCAWLAGWNGLPDDIREVRLPTEAEWEYACRAWTETEYYNGDGESALAEVAWYDANSGNKTHPVDERREEHPFGLYGMHGNVWEWCQDVYDEKAYRKCEDGWEAVEWRVDDAGEDAEFYNEEDRRRGMARRVLRGGSWSDPAGVCRSAFRLRSRPGERFRLCGFRVCLVLGPSLQTASRKARRSEPRETESDGAGVAEPAGLDLARASFPKSVGRKKGRKK